MEKTAYVRIEREYGENFYYCRACGGEITDFVKRNFKAILAKKIAGERLICRCPHCKKRLNWLNIGLTMEIMPSKLSDIHRGERKREKNKK